MDLFFKLTSKRRLSKRAERGAAMVELAISLFVLVIMVSGILQIGKVVSHLPHLFQISFNAAYLASATGNTSSMSLDYAVFKASELNEIKKNPFSDYTNFAYTIDSTVNGTGKNATMTFDSSFISMFSLYQPFTVHNHLTVGQLVTPPDLTMWAERSNSL